MLFGDFLNNWPPVNTYIDEKTYICVINSFVYSRVMVAHKRQILPTRKTRVTTYFDDLIIKVLWC
jgi:hypothetical protein